MDRAIPSAGRSVREEAAMTEPSEKWVDRLKELTGEPPGEKAEKFVHDLYTTAQKDLDAQRAQAEFEREE
ncbi:hypothetical protein EAO69_22385 [Streptomyces sp. me109]|nr:hypothetical protein EAO69_22385 [Streptomyces sp. me109]